MADSGPVHRAGRGAVEAHRLYDDRHGSFGYRVLVDRLWPRGIAKKDVEFDEWDKDVSPSNELRKRFHSAELDFDGFSAEYRAELERSEAPDQLLERFARSRKRKLILLYGAKDAQHNHARVLGEYLEERKGQE